MRISTNQVFQNGLSGMQRASASQAHTLEQLGAKKRILTPADDPSGAAHAVLLQSAIDTTKQFQRNADLVKPHLEQEDSQLKALENYLFQARDLVLTGNNDPYNDDQRKMMASQIRQIRDDLMEVANFREANGEYLFAGTNSSQIPFVENEAGAVAYLGAEGTGEIREVAIAPTRAVQMGDTGKSIFMDIPDKSGWEAEAFAHPANTGTLEVEHIEVFNKEKFDQRPDETFTIKIEQDTTPGAPPEQMRYSVIDHAGDPVNNENDNPIAGVYRSGDTIAFEGRAIILTGEPEDGDEVAVRPAQNRSIFDTLDSIATALEASHDSAESRERLADASARALDNLGSSLDRLNEVRASVGIRLQSIDAQTDLNAERKLDLQVTLSDIRDLDYAEAISRFKHEQVVLEAAQKAYVQTSRLSLLNYL